MLSKVALLVKSKVALAALGVAVVGTGGTAALAATGHLPSLPAQSNATQSAHGDNGDGNHGHTVSIEGTLKAYNAGAKTISVQAEDAKSATTIGVNNDTRVNGAQATKLSDLTANIGHKVQVQATKQSNGSLVAWKITVTSATDDHSQDSDNSREVVGTISSVNANGFVVKTAKGDSVVVVVNSKTAFAGVANALAKVKTGMRVEVHGTMQSNGSMLADSIRVDSASQSGDNSAGH